MNTLKLNDKEIDMLATKYEKILPKVFGKWNYLKSKIDESVYTLRLLSRGLIADNPQILTNSKTPFYELMSYLSIKYQRNFESISEEELANQISLWFYINLLYQPFSKTKKQFQGIKRLNPIFNDDLELKKWFLDFYKEAKKYYKIRYEMMKTKV